MSISLCLKKLSLDCQLLIQKYMRKIVLFLCCSKIVEHVPIFHKRIKEAVLPVNCLKKLLISCRPPFYKCNEKSCAEQNVVEEPKDYLPALHENKRNRAGVGMLLFMNATLSLSCSFRGAVA